jgi:hypothetical protein
MQSVQMFLILSDWGHAVRTHFFDFKLCTAPIVYGLHVPNLIKSKTFVRTACPQPDKIKKDHSNAEIQKSL